MPAAARTKVVVRRLPANLPEPIFWTSVSEWVTPDTVTWRSYQAGKLKSRFDPIPDKFNDLSRAYIVFKTADQVARFSREYDGHAFRDKQGNESFAIVEFAPFQKAPQDRKKSDARVGTILQDDDYKSFLESLEAAEPVAELETTRIDPKTTPLLEKLKAEKAAAKDAAQIQSYHGHYRGADRRAPASAIKSKVLPSRSDDLATFSRSLPPSGGESAKSARPITPNGKTPTKGKGKAETVPQSPSKQPPVAKTPKKTQPRPTAVRSNPAAASTKSEAVASSSANSTIVSEANNNPRPERKKQAVNPRMFEAALAGVGGGTSRRQAAAAKKLQEAAVRPPVSSTTSNAPPPSISPTISAASTASPIAPVTSSSTMEKKEKPIPTGPKNQGQNAPRLPSGEGGVQGEAAPAKGRRRGKPHPNRDSQAPIQSSATPTITPIILARPAPSVSPTSPTAGSGVPVAQRAPSTASQPNQSAASNSTTHAAAAGAPKEGAGGPPKNRRTRPGRGRGRGGAPAIATAGGSSGTTPASGET